MRFIETPLPGAFIVEIDPIADERGFFARSWCSREFEEHGLETRLGQCNISYNARRGTLRGLHYQEEPYPEAKLVRCTRGAIFDVIVDLRPDSRTYLRWHAVELDERNRRMLYIPFGMAHGLQTLQDDTEVFYQMSESYYPDHARGVRWDDPWLSIKWPVPEPILSPRDASLPLLDRLRVAQG